MSSNTLYILSVISSILENISLAIMYESIEKKKFNYMKAAIFVIISSITIPIMSSFSEKIFSLTLYIIMIIILKIIYKDSMFDTLLKFVIMLLIAMVSELILSVLIGYAYKCFGYNVDMTIRGACVTPLLLIICVCIYRFVPIRKYYLRYKYDIKQSYRLVLSIFIYICGTKFIYDNKNEFVINNSIFFIMIPVLFITVITAYLLYTFKVKEQMKDIETYNQYSPIIVNLIDDVRRRQHDFKNHLNTIYGIVQTSDGDDLKRNLEDYLKGLNFSFREMDKFVEVDNKILAAIVYSKMQQANELGINFNYMIKSNLKGIGLKEYEYSEILNNLLDNAFEATVKIKDDRNVFLKVGFEGGKYIIETKNNSLPMKIDDAGEMFNKGFTTKKGEGHGYGLYNVKKIVETHMGKIQLSFEEEYIIIRIEIP
ncbi:MAG: GHKL domain-containing protein [Bacillota bacterium]|nr:GHKL domain-containing protein [Bacillota bacterium]